MTPFMPRHTDYFVVMNRAGEFFGGFKFVREFPDAKLYKHESEARGVAAVCSRRQRVVVVRNYGRGDEAEIFDSEVEARKAAAAKPEAQRTIYDRINAGEYKSGIPFAKENFKAIAAKEVELLAKFKADLLADHGVTTHPKADRCYSIAWEMGHAYGLTDVASTFSQLVELIK